MHSEIKDGKAIQETHSSGVASNMEFDLTKTCMKMFFTPNTVIKIFKPSIQYSYFYFFAKNVHKYC
jgi:hypothetical protein